MWRYIVRGTRGNPVAMSAFSLTTMIIIPIGLGTVIMSCGAWPLTPTLPPLSRPSPNPPDLLHLSMSPHHTSRDCARSIPSKCLNS